MGFRAKGLGLSLKHVAASKTWTPQRIRRLRTMIIPNRPACYGRNQAQAKYPSPQAVTRPTHTYETHMHPYEARYVVHFVAPPWGPSSTSLRHASLFSWLSDHVPGVTNWSGLRVHDLGLGFGFSVEGFGVLGF